MRCDIDESLWHTIYKYNLLMHGIKMESFAKLIFQWKSRIVDLYDCDIWNIMKHIYHIRLMYIYDSLEIEWYTVMHETVMEIQRYGW